MSISTTNPIVKVEHLEVQMNNLNPFFQSLLSIFIELFVQKLNSVFSELSKHIAVFVS